METLQYSTEKMAPAPPTIYSSSPRPEGRSDVGLFSFFLNAPNAADQVYLYICISSIPKNRQVWPRTKYHTDLSMHISFLKIFKYLTFTFKKKRTFEMKFYLLFLNPKIGKIGFLSNKRKNKKK